MSKKRLQNGKKVLTGILAATMVLGSSSMVFAAGVSENEVTDTSTAKTTAIGQLEGVSGRQIFKVVLPTFSAKGSGDISFIMDPYGLIEETKGASHADDGMTDKNFDPKATVLFAVSGNDGVSWNGTSKSYKAINKGMVSVNIGVSAEIKNGDEITMAGTKTALKSEEKPSLYMALVNQDNEETAINSDSTNSKKAVSDNELAGAPSNYILSWNKADGYHYEEKGGVSANSYQSCSFALTASCNKVDGWEDVKTSKPEVEFVWSVENPLKEQEQEQGPKLEVTPKGAITVSGLTKEKDYEKMEVTYNGKTYDVNANPMTWDTSNWKAEDGTITGGIVKGQFGDVWMNALSASGKEKVTLTLTDGDTKSVEVQFTK